MHKTILFTSIILFLVTGLCVADEESLTITTYYPSPFGVYNQLLTNRLGIGDNNDDGTLNDYDAPDNDGDVWIAGDVRSSTLINCASLATDSTGKISCGGPVTGTVIGSAILKTASGPSSCLRCSNPIGQAECISRPPYHLCPSGGTYISCPEGSKGVFVINIEEEKPVRSIYFCVWQ